MKWTSQRVERLRELVSIGWSDDEIADLLASSPTAVRQARYRHHVPRPTRKDSNLGRSLEAVTEPVTTGTDVTAGLSRRLAQLSGLEPPREASSEPLSDEDLHPWLEDPFAFLAWVGIPLHPYQQDAVRLFQGNERTILAWSRQAGKDHVTSAYALWLALTRPGSVIVTVSPSQRQSDLWLSRAKEFALSKPEIREDVTSLAQTEVGFGNGSRIHSLPSGTSGGVTIRGFSRVSLLIFNEAAFVDSQVYRAATPFLAASSGLLGGLRRKRGGKVILISTPWGESGPFYEAWESDLYTRSHIPATEVPHISPEFLEAERRSMDAIAFETEYMAQFVSAADAYYPTELVARATVGYDLVETPQPEHDGLAFYCGWDPARTQDESVVTVVGVDEEGGVGKVLWIRAMQDISYTEQLSYLNWLDSEWRFRRVYVDASAHAIVDALISQGLSVEDVSFSLQGKIELHGRLKSAFEGGRIVIPRHPDMLRQLASFRYKITESGNLTLHGGRDDYVDSLALAARDLTKPIDFGEPRDLRELFEAAREGLDTRPPGTDLLPPEPSRYNPMAGVESPRMRGPIGAPACNICGKPVRNLTELKRHQRDEHPERTP